jgi:hypothetical protein
VTEPPDEHAIGYQVLPRGVPVEASDGQNVGALEKAIHHPREHMLDGIVVRTKDGRVFVDAPEVARITNRRIILAIDSAEFARCPAYRGRLGRIGEEMNRRAVRRAARLRRR